MCALDVYIIYVLSVGTPPKEKPHTHTKIMSSVVEEIYFY